MEIIKTKEKEKEKKKPVGKEQRGFANKRH